MSYDSLRQLSDFLINTKKGVNENKGYSDLNSLLEQIIDMQSYRSTNTVPLDGATCNCVSRTVCDCVSRTLCDCVSRTLCDCVSYNTYANCPYTCNNWHCACNARTCNHCTCNARTCNHCVCVSRSTCICNIDEGYNPGELTGTLCISNVMGDLDDLSLRGVYNASPPPCSCHTQVETNCLCQNRTVCDCVSRTVCDCVSRTLCHCVSYNAFPCAYVCNHWHCACNARTCNHCSCNARTCNHCSCNARTCNHCICNARCSCNSVEKFS